MTKIPDAAVQAALEAGDMEGWDHIDERMRDALNAALPHLPLGYEEKKLDWQEPTKETNGCWTAKTVFGTYSVVNESGWYAVLDDHAYGTGGFEWLSKDLSKDTRQTAFAAAQADFERRVRECITLTNEGTKPVDVSAVRRQAFEEAATLIDEGFEKAVGKPWRNDGKSSKNDRCPHDKFMYEDCENCASAAIRALSAEPAQVEQWRDIATAPKDMTEIIVLCGQKDIRLGWYFAPSSQTFGWFDQRQRKINPTHWMPLPAAPTTEVEA